MDCDFETSAPKGFGLFEGKMLLALPGTAEGSYFDKSVIYICAHSDEGAMGLIVNQTMPMVEFGDLEEQIGLPQSEILVRPKILFGGPVETSRGFVLHTRDVNAVNSVPINENLALNATVNILKKIARGEGPEKSIFVLGYAGWGPGQLEEEVRNNLWLSLDADEELLFGPEIDLKWQRGLSKMGVTPEHLSGFSGRA